MMFTALSLDEASRLMIRKILTDAYRKTGDYTSYLMPPCLLWWQGDRFSERIEIGSGIYKLSDSPIWNGYATVLPAEDGTPFPLALFVSRKESIAYTFPSISVSVSGVLLLDCDDKGFSILRQRPLKKDRAL